MNNLKEDKIAAQPTRLPLVFLSAYICVHLWTNSIVLAEPVKGMSLAHLHRRGFGYGSDECRKQLAEIAALGANWVAITDFGYMPSVDAPELRFGGDRSLSDANLTQCVADAHALGLKVMLKPYIWSNQYISLGKWQGDIRMTNEEDWNTWFDSYTRYMVHHAQLAKTAKIDALCIGTEMEGTSGQEQRWRQVIAAVRREYAGHLTYASTWGEWQQIQWWDALDCIGIDAYFPIAKSQCAEEPELRRGWEAVYAKLAPFSSKWNKPICFTEIGYTVSQQAGREPWKCDGIVGSDPAYQARLYKVAIEEAAKRDYVVGLFAWKWFTSGEFKRFEREDYFAIQDRPLVRDTLRSAWERKDFSPQMGHR